MKEAVEVPWVVPSKPSPEATSTSSTEQAAASTLPASTSSQSPAAPAPEPSFSSPSASPVAPTPAPRVLAARHFAKALHEITPSASESLGTLSSLRKWNDEFGEGATSKVRKQRGWGGKFGFGLPGTSPTSPGGVVPTIPVPAVETPARP